jgi:large subunit ribosomal protein L28
MSRMCDICGKKTGSGNNVSHSHKKTKRVFKPNIQKARVEINGRVKNINICTSCLKANKVKKVI